MIEQTTPALGLQLPHPANELAVDVVRLRAALNALDAIVSQKFGAAETSAAIAAVRADSMPVDRQASTTVLGGIKIGAGLSIDENGVASVPSAAAGTQTFIEVTITPTSDGQLSFAVPAGYVPLLINVYLNGVLLINGDDYTATDGTNLLLSFGANTTDTLLVRKWSRFESTDYYTRAEVDNQVPTKVVKPLEYDDRAQLRTTTGHLALVDGLGLFQHVAGSDEPDDDETCFATASGRWVLQAPHWDVIYALMAAEISAQDVLIDSHEASIASLLGRWPGRVLHGSAASSITSIAAGAQASFTGTITGAAVGDKVLATPHNALAAQVSLYALVSAADTVTVYLNNPSATAATLTAGTFKLTVFKET